MSRPRRQALHTCEYNEVCLWRCVSADRCATPSRDPHAAVHPVEPNAINSTPTIVRPARWPSYYPLSRAVVWWWHRTRYSCTPVLSWPFVQALSGVLACGSPCAFWPSRPPATGRHETLGQNSSSSRPVVALLGRVYNSSMATAEGSRHARTTATLLTARASKAQRY